MVSMESPAFRMIMKANCRLVSDDIVEVRFTYLATAPLKQLGHSLFFSLFLRVHAINIQFVSLETQHLLILRFLEHLLRSSVAHHVGEMSGG